MKASNNADDSLCLQSTYGALFFRVPRQGMDVEAMAAMVGELPVRYTLNLLDHQVGFRLRSRQHEDFCKAFDFPDSCIVQFFELRKSHTVQEVSFKILIEETLYNIHDLQDKATGKWSRDGPLRLLVSPASATRGRSWEVGDDNIISLSGDHFDMIKFTESDLDGYEKVRHIMQSFVQEATPTIRNRLQASKSKAV